MRNLVREKSKKSKLPTQQLYGLYAMDRLILKLSDSVYSRLLIVKGGGFLLTTHLGINSRATRDIDFTVIDFKLSNEMISNLVSVIESNGENSNEYFKIKEIKKFHSNLGYDGYSLSIDYFNESTKKPISVDFTTGEKLISIAEHAKFKSIFTNEQYLLSSYMVEQIIVDKFYTLIAYGSYDDTNTRMKDYYDLYLIRKINTNINYSLINEGLDLIMYQRDTIVKKSQYIDIINYLHQSEYQRALWNLYSKKVPYAKDLFFDDVMNEIKILAKTLIECQ